MKNDISGFDELPDQALVSINTVSAVLSLGVSSIWSKAKTEPLLKPISLIRGVTRFRVGELRRYMAGHGEAVSR